MFQMREELIIPAGPQSPQKTLENQSLLSQDNTDATPPPVNGVQRRTFLFIIPSLLPLIYFYSDAISSLMSSTVNVCRSPCRHLSVFRCVRCLSLVPGAQLSFQQISAAD